MQIVEVKSNIYVDFDKENNGKDPHFKANHQTRISECKKNSAKGYVPNWSEDVFIIKKV